MNSWLGLLQQGLFLAAFISCASAVLVAVTYPALEPGLARLAPVNRANLLLLLCVLPAIAVVGILFSALLPSILQLAGFGSDHCEGHTEGHLHFCLLHRPAVLDNWWFTLPALFYLGLAGAMGANLVLDLYRGRLLRNLIARSQVVATLKGARVLASELPLAFTLGVLPPRIMLSTGLLRQLSTRERDLLIAHEQAHVSRHDGLCGWLARALSLAHLPAVRRMLLRDMHLAAEQACDAAAARCSGDPAGLAALLLKIERLYQRYFPQGGVLAPGILGTGASTLPLRIQALLQPLPAPGMPWLPPLGVLLFLFLLVGSHDLFHDWLEHALELVVEGL